MSAIAISTFMNYFNAFEAALDKNNWDPVSGALSEGVTYTVEGVPFACRIQGRDAVVEAFKRSTQNFDATMDFRQLEVLNITRLAPEQVRVDLLSGYGRASVGSMTVPVTIEVETSEGKIRSLRDRYDPELTGPALSWLAANIQDADPSYLQT